MLCILHYEHTSAQIIDDSTDIIPKFVLGILIVANSVIQMIGPLK